MLIFNSALASKEAFNINMVFSLDSSAYQRGKVFLQYYSESDKRSGYVA